MIDNVPIKVHTLDGKSITLLLRGIILTYIEKNWAAESSVDVPLELIKISTLKKRNGNRLILALLSFIYVPGFFYIIYCVVKLFYKNPSFHIAEIFIFAAIVFSSLTFLALFIYFLIKQENILLEIKNSNTKIDFWVHKKNKNNIHKLINEILIRQNNLDDVAPFPMDIITIDYFETPWKKIIILSLLITFPSIIFENFWLLIPAAVPFIYYLYISLLKLRCPKNIRDAYKLYDKKQWLQAAKRVDECLQDFPDFIELKLLKIDLMLRLYNFNDAENLLAEIENELDSNLLQTIQHEIIIRKRIHSRQKIFK